MMVMVVMMMIFLIAQVLCACAYVGAYHCRMIVITRVKVECKSKVEVKVIENEGDVTIWNVPSTATARLRLIVCFF
jgi:hypothetical protein